MAKKKRINQNEVLVASLVIDVAGGKSIRRWAEENGVPEQTAYSWSREPDFKPAVDARRRELIDACVGQLTVKTERATETLGELMEGSQYPRLRLEAAIAILDRVIDLSQFADFEKRLSALEKKRNGSQASVCQPPSS